MLKAVDVADDTYRDGRFVRLWVIVDGHARCVEDALDTTTAPAKVIKAAQAANRTVVERLAAVESLEEARSLTAGGPPDQWAVGHNADGLPCQVENPAWTAYQTALATIAKASPLTKAYATVRAWQPTEQTTGEDPSPAWETYQAALAVIAAA